MGEVCLFSGTTKPKLSFSKDLDYCQKALDKMDDIDRSSTSHKFRILLRTYLAWVANKYPKIQEPILPGFKTDSFLYAGVYCLFKKTLSMFQLLSFLSKYSSDVSSFNKRKG